MASASARRSARRAKALSGRASPKDLETMFQLIYLDFTAPRLDTAAFAGVEESGRRRISPNRGVDPDEVFGDTVQVTMAQHNFRARPLTPAMFARGRSAQGVRVLQGPVRRRERLHVRVRRQRRHGDAQAARREVSSRRCRRRAARRRSATTAARRRRASSRRVVRKGVEPKANTIIMFTGACDVRAADPVRVPRDESSCSRSS